MLIKVNYLISRKYMNNTNVNLNIKNIDDEALLKKSLGMFSTGITIVST